MRTKRILSAVLACSMTATAMLGSAAFQASAAEKKTLTFDIRSDGKNEVKITADDIASGDFTIPVSIYIPENPGVNGINLKLQINDGQVDAKGAFGNYGLYLNDGDMASPFCFGSASKGNAAASAAKAFNCKDMNISWVFSDNPDLNADAAVQAETTEWDASAAWAYTNAFVTTNLVVPKDTPAGTYQLDIRKDQYLNARSAECDTPYYGKSSCIGADSDAELSFNSVPLTVEVEAVSSGETPWKDSYDGADSGHYLIIGDVAGAPGETVDVPVYVYNDKTPGTAGMQLFFDSDEGLKLVKFADPNDKLAYEPLPQCNPESDPASFTFADSVNTQAEDGSIITVLKYEIPETARAGTCYNVNFYSDSASKLKVVNYDGVELPVKFFNGSVTVLYDTNAAINHTSFNAREVGETVNLTVFNATGNVTWKSSDEAVATVDANGFVKITGKGTATITAKTGDKELTCSINVNGMFGDVNENGEVSADDAQLTLQHYVATMAGKQGGLTEARQAIADVDGNNEVSIEDAQFILMYYVKKILGKNYSTTWRQITGNPNSPADY